MRTCRLFLGVSTYRVWHVQRIFVIGTPEFLLRRLVAMGDVLAPLPRRRTWRLIGLGRIIITLAAWIHALVILIDEWMTGDLLGASFEYAGRSTPLRASIILESSDLEPDGPPAHRSGFTCPVIESGTFFSEIPAPLGSINHLGLHNTKFQHSNEARGKYGKMNP